MSAIFFKIIPLTLVSINSNFCMRFGFVETCHGTLTAHGEVQEYQVRVYDATGYKIETHHFDTISNIEYDHGLHRIAKALGIFDRIQADIVSLKQEVAEVEAEDAALTPAQPELKAS